MGDDNTMDLEKEQMPETGSSGSSTLASQQGIEKVDSVPELSQIPTTVTSASRRIHSNIITRTRSVATDGYSCADLDGDQLDDNEDVESARENDTNAFEVRWDSEDDPLCPRNFHLARKWLIVLLACSTAFCV